MKKMLCFSLSLMFAIFAFGEWKGFTEENYACGPKLTPSALKGKVVLVDMWATWCGPCKMMMPHTQEIADKFKGRALVVIGSHVDSGYNKTTVENYVKQNGFTFSFYKGAGLASGVPFDGGIPFLYVVDKKGNIVCSGRNPAAIEAAIEKALGKAGGPMFLNDAELVEYKSLKGKLLPGKNVEPIVKRLKADVEKASKNPESATFAKRKVEALKIAEAIKEYKKDLVESIGYEIEQGNKEAAAKAIDLLVATWPSSKSEWAAKRKALKCGK